MLSVFGVISPVGPRPASNLRNCALARIAVVLALGFSIHGAARACKCAGSSSVCQALASADVVFAGRVEATDPDFDPWDPELRQRLANLFPGRDLDDVDLDNGMTPETLEQLKNIYSAVFPYPIRTAIQKARNHKDLQTVIEKAIDRGRRFTFRVHRAFKGIPPQQALIDIWTDFSDCGVHFSRGETYLVYASANNEDRYTARACSRTARLTDAGQDLAYFFFRENAAGTDGRIYGFLTSNQLDLPTPRFGDYVANPIPEMLIELRANGTDLRLLSETNQGGRFVFDGLPPGEYDIAVFGPNYPEERKQLGDTRRVRIDRSACKAEVIYVPKSSVESKE